MTLLQDCLNGNRPREDHPAVPVSAGELAEDARHADRRLTHVAPGFLELCELLASHGVGIEAGVWTLANTEALLQSGIRPLRVLVETSDAWSADPVAEAARRVRAGVGA